MDHELLGYVLGALGTDETRSIEQLLTSDSRARRQLELLQRALASMRSAYPDVDCPDGLAIRTCRHVRGLRGGRPGA